MADPRDEALALAESAIALIAEAGASDADATVTVADRFSCEARDLEVTKLERSRGRSLHVRAFVGKRRATLATSDLSREGIAALAKRAVAAAAFVGEDPHAGLPDEIAPDGVCDHDLLTVSPDVAERGDEEKIEEALAMERAVREADARIGNSDGSRVRDSLVSWGLANTRGFRGVTQGSQVSRAAAPVAVDGDDKRIGHYGTAARGWSTAESAEAVSLHAVHRALALIGARKPATMRVPVIFERDVAAAVLGDVFSALSAANVAIGNSWLADRVGKRIGNERVTIVDDGRLRGGLGSSPFDGEGVATRETTVVRNGVLETYLSDTYWGRRIGMASTGNASNGSVGANNLYLVPGGGTLDDLVASTERGVLVLDTIGFATEYASGLYSRGARGIYIENGAPQYAIDEFTIASTFEEMLGAVDGIAGDLRFDGTIVSPSFRVAEMTISGT
ncbi:MAG TPA: TldD/PmbA family protein [Candidatus Elarobacter sp.]|nr:TldD/PmbA family protein [Dongiaceae bacterium]HZW52814.1 TldD/PmbA family protein [Candidatus Elarobacter sp.]